MAFDISDDHVQQFQEQGYLVLPGVFDDDEVRRMQGEADYILELILNSSLAHGRRSRRLEWQEADGQQQVRKIQPINDLSLWLTQVSQDDRLLQPMRRIMNDEPVLMEEKLNYKQPLPERIDGLEIRTDTDGHFPIHHDWAYYAAQNYPTAIVSSAISMDACTVDNGPLHIWPGTHLQNLEHVPCSIGLEVKPGLVDPDGGIDVLVPPGSVMFFHSLLVHNSRKNSTPRPRRLMIYSHYPKKFNMCFDVRNGPTRLNEGPYEHQYLRMRHQGAYKDTFRAPEHR